MKEVCNKSICTGCSLCASICNRKSISMQSIDKLGHLFPVINQQTCVNCGLCQKVCPSLQTLPKQKPQECYAAWAKDAEDYKSSTSGGVASVLSQFVIKQGGVVYGCAMLPDVEVKHIRVDKAEDLTKLKGSKYVQSNISEALPLIVKDVKDGRLVLFTGTPCQCGAVKHLFKRQPDNLFLVDLICHGVPSLKSLRQHVFSKAGSISIDKVVFRDIEGHYILGIIADGKECYKSELRSNRYEDLYINPFFYGYTFRDSCYTCQYARLERAFDITIGDFWGLGKIVPAPEIPEHPNGCSVILPTTQKGIELLRVIQDSMKIYRRGVDEAVIGNDQLRHPFKQNNRIILFRFLIRIGISFCVYKLCVLDKILKCKSKRIINKVINK